jgi:L-lactate dehydrogenase complex protein LldE
MRVSLFIPCLVDQLFPETGIAMLAVLRRLGVDVDYNPAQTCCGQPAMNTGYRHEARELAERWLRIFEGSEYIVGPSGSCVSMIRNLYRELWPEGFPEHYSQLCGRTFEFSEFLVQKMHVTDVGSRFAHTVTYHDSCHLLRELGIKEEPRQLLSHVNGLTLIEMAESDACCGFGGTFAVKFAEISTVMAERKIESITRTGAEFVVANDSSCLMQIGGFLHRIKSPVKPIHLAEILAQE